MRAPGHDSVTLFFFFSHGELYALPGTDVTSVIDATQGRDLILEDGGTTARYRGRRVPVSFGPSVGTVRSVAAGEPPVYLVVGAEHAGQRLLRVDSAGGLLHLSGSKILPLPAYLFGGRVSMYRGLFLMAEQVGVLLDMEALALSGERAV